MIAFTKETWRAMGIHVFMFKELDKSEMDVGSFTRIQGIRNYFFSYARECCNKSILMDF